MIATLLLQGAFLWLTSSLVMAVAWSILRRWERRHRAWRSGPAAMCERDRIERHARRFAHLEEGESRGY